MTGTRNRTVAERLIESSVDTSDGCRLWVGSVSRNGHGKISVDSRARLPHRLAFEAFVGPIPDGHDLDHLCRNRACILPAHLEPVTRAENLRRGVQIGSRLTGKHPVNYPPSDRTNEERERIIVAGWLLSPNRISRKDAAASLANLGHPIAPETISLWRHGHMCPSAENLEWLTRAVGATLTQPAEQVAA